MAEEQELKLSVTLDDKASEQLARLQQTLSGLANAASNTSGLNSFAQGLSGASQHAHGLHGGLMGMAAKVGTIGGFFFQVGKQVANMAEEFAKAVLDIKAYSDEMVRLDQNAQRAATSMAQFRANSAAFRESGISAEQSTRMLQGYSGALANLQRQDSSIRQAMLRGQQGASRENMLELLKTVDTRSQQEGINAIKAYGEQIKQEWVEKGQAERGAAAQASFYAKMGMPGLENFRGKMEEASAAEKKMYDDRDKDAKRFQTSQEKINASTDDLVKSVQSIAFQILPINEVSETLAGWWQKISKHAENYERDLRRAKISMQNTPAPGWFEGGLFPTSEQVAARIRQRQAGEIVLHPPPVDQAPGGTFRGGGTYGGGGLYGSDIEEGQEATPLPGEKPIPREWVEEAKKEWAKMPSRRPSTSSQGGGAAGYRRTPPPGSVIPGAAAPPPASAARPGAAAPPPASAAAHFMGDTGEAGGGPAGAGTELQRAYEANIEQIDDLTDEFRRLNDFFEAAELSGRKPGDVLGAGRGTGTGTGTGTGPGGTDGGGGDGRRRGGGDDGTSKNPPAQSQNPPAQATAQPAPGQPGGPGPYGQPMPAWGTTETGPADFGGGTGGGVAGGVQGVPGGPSGRALTPEERAAGGVIGGGGAAPAPATGAPAAAAAPAAAGGGGGGGGGANAPLPGGTGSGAIYNKLLAEYRNSGLVGTIPKDGARYGFKTGSAEEWARFGMIIAAAESDYDPKNAVSNSKEQSFGIFQYNHPQVEGGNAFNVDASVKAFVRDSKTSMATHGSLGPGSILYRRFSTIQNTPPPNRARQADAAIAAARQQQPQPQQPQPQQPQPQQPQPQQPQSTELGPNALPPPGTVPPGSMTTAGPGAVPPQPSTTTTPQTAVPQAPATTPPAAAPPAAAGSAAGSLKATAPRTYERRRGEPGEFDAAYSGEFGPPGKNITTITLKNGQKLEVNAAVADRFKAHFDNMIDKGYPVDVRGGGGFNYRNKRGSSKLSIHSWATAADINVSKNPFRGKTTNMPEGVEEEAWLHGLSWGGRFGDPMHFEAMSKQAWANKLDLLVKRGRITSEQRTAILEKGVAAARTVNPAAPPTANAQTPPATAAPPATTPPYRNPATALYEHLNELDRNRPGAPIDAQKGVPGTTIQDVLKREPEEGAIVVPGTTLRAGRPPAKPPSTLDLSTIDKAPSENVNVTGVGKVSVDVKSVTGENSKKDEPLAKPVHISKQESMKPASPTGAEANAEE